MRKPEISFTLAQEGHPKGVCYAELMSGDYVKIYMVNGRPKCEGIDKSEFASALAYVLLFDGSFYP